jgi:phage terminase large subunit-like protein
MTTIQIPELHSGQQKAYDSTTRFSAICCGRRFGKTVMMQAIACGYAASGKRVGWFTPSYKIQAEAWNEITDILSPVIKSSSKLDGVITTETGGRIDFWTLENDRAGRSRKYHIVMIDEAAFTKPNMMHVWQTAIKPSLLDYTGECIAASTPNGVNEENFFYQICHDKTHGFSVYHAPTRDNPYMPVNELKKLERENHPLVYKQEYLAEFVNWGGDAFFSDEKMLVDGKPVQPWDKSDMVFAVIDTAVKTGKHNDGTAVIYFMYDKYRADCNLIVMDWDIVQIEGSLLEAWLPNVRRRLDDFGQGCRYADKYIYIEDKASGSILIQQAMRRNIDAISIDSKLTAVGKDERAISVSGYFHQGKIKISEHAYNKITTYKEYTCNQFLSQVCGFKLGIDNGKDDLLDCFTYGISIALGNVEGY